MPLLKTESKLFTFLIGIGAMGLAIWAAVFSVTGLAMLYSGERFFIAIAMSFLEYAKLIVASALYRHWSEITLWLKSYLSIGLFILMIITSGGIYGYMTYAYQGTTIGIERLNSETQLLEQQQENLLLERERITSEIGHLRDERQNIVQNRIAEIDANNAATDSNSVKYRAYRNRTVYERYSPELTRIDGEILKYIANLDSTNVKISRLNDNVADKKLEMINTGGDVGPLVAMSRIFDVKMDVVMKWYTLIIIFVFDPMALALVILLNFIIKRNKEIILELGDSESGIIKESNVMWDGNVADIPGVDIKADENIVDSYEFSSVPNDIYKPIIKVDPETGEYDLSEPMELSEDFYLPVQYSYSELPAGINFKFNDGELDKIEQEIDSEEEDVAFLDKIDEIADGDGTVEQIHLSDDEIKGTFEDAMRESRKKHEGERDVVYEPGGKVRVDHSIQE